MARMLPSEIRNRLLADHERIRKLLDEMEAASARALAGERGADEAQTQRARTLREVLLDHVRREEEWLSPILETVDSWSEVRLDRMHQEHGTQRALLYRMVGDAAVETDAAERSRLFHRLASDIRYEMAQEERFLLHADVLRDDIVNIAQVDG